MEFGFTGQFFIRWSSSYYLFFSITSFCLSLSLAWFFIAVHKKNVLVVRFHPKQIDIEVGIIKEYLEKKFSKMALPVQELEVEVDRAQKLHISAKLQKFPDMQELENLEKELGILLGAKFGYFKDFQVAFSKS